MRKNTSQNTINFSLQKFFVWTPLALISYVPKRVSNEKIESVKTNIHTDSFCAINI